MKSKKVTHVKESKAEEVHMSLSPRCPLVLLLAAPEYPTLDFGVKEHAPNWGKYLQASKSLSSSQT